MDMRVAAEASGSDGQPWTLPVGWCWATIDRIAPINPTTTFDDLAEDSDVPFVPMAAVSEETGAIDLSMKRPVAEVSKGYVRFQQGDVLFAKITPCMENGKVAPVPALQGGYAAGSTEFHILRPIAVDQKFLWYWLVSRRFRHEAQRNMSGSAGQLRVPAAFLRQSWMPLAPLPEQIRIVERIDTLFAEIAEGKAALEKAGKELETFRRALLKSAVTGELTRDWRETCQPKETGLDLFARIKAERDAMPAKGRSKRAAANPPLDTSDLPELPEGWAWERLSALGEFGRGKSKHRPRDDARLYGGNIPFIQTGIVANAVDYIKTYSQTYSEFGVSQSKIWPEGTLCITIAANIAKTSITTFDCCFPDSIVGLVPSDCIDAYWIHVWLQTIQQRLEQYAPATAQKNINLEVLNSVAVPIPPPAEMAEALVRIKAALIAYEDVKLSVAAGFADAARLRQAILKSAFEGMLVPQDPADEPAFAFLSRLKAEETVNPKHIKRRKKV